MGKLGNHQKADVDRLYIPRFDGGKGMSSIEESVKLEECKLFYLKDSVHNKDGP